MKAISTLAIPVLTYVFNIVDCTIPDIKKMDTKIQKLFTSKRMHLPKIDIDWLYVCRYDGGRGMIQMEITFKITTIRLHKYLTTINWMLQLLLKQILARTWYSRQDEWSSFLYHTGKRKGMLKMKKLNN